MNGWGSNELDGTRDMQGKQFRLASHLDGDPDSAEMRCATRCRYGVLSPVSVSRQHSANRKEQIMAYRRRKSSDTWHWCRNCPQYPTSGYVQSARKPASGELCNTCKAKERNRTCQR